MPCDDPDLCGWYADRKNEIIYPNSSTERSTCPEKFPARGERPQMFQNCVDIAITPGAGGPSPPTAVPTTPSPAPPPETTDDEEEDDTAEEPAAEAEFMEETESEEVEEVEDEASAPDESSGKGFSDLNGGIVLADSREKVR